MKLRPVDFLILEVLTDGRNVNANISAEIDRERHYVSNRMGYLLDYGLVTKIGPNKNVGLYEITEKGEAVIDLQNCYGEVSDFDQTVERYLSGDSTLVQEC